MIDDSQSSATYFKELSKLAEDLKNNKISIYEHNLNYMAFGSWELVAGRRDKMIRFTYDGKDSYLLYHNTEITPKSYEDLQHKRFATHEGEDPFEFVAQVLLKEFSV